MNFLHPAGTGGSMCLRMVETEILVGFLKNLTFTFHQHLILIASKSVMYFVLFQSHLRLMIALSMKQACILVT